MKNDSLVRYLRSRPGGHSLESLVTHFKKPAWIMYAHVRRALKQDLIDSHRINRRVYYGINPKWPVDWSTFYKSTYCPKIQLDDFYRILDPTWKRTKITLRHRIRFKIRRFRIWLADNIYPHER